MAWTWRCGSSDGRPPADQRDVPPEPGRDHPDPAGEDREGVPRDGRADRPEETLPLGLRDRSADDDPVRVEGVDVADTARRDGAPGAIHQLDTRGIARLGALPDVLRRQLDRLAQLAGPRREERRGARDHERPRLAGQRRATGERLDVALATAAAARPVEGDLHVPELAREPVRAVEQPAAGEDRAADPGRDRQVDEVVDAEGRPEGVLAQRGDVRVAVEEGRQPR
jgi:hypothetical protein